MWSIQYVGLKCPFLRLFNSHLSAFTILFKVMYIMYNYLYSPPLKVLHFSRDLLIFSSVLFHIYS